VPEESISWYDKIFPQAKKKQNAVKTFSAIFIKNGKDPVRSDSKKRF